MKSKVTPDNTEVPWMTSLTSCLERMKEEGYREDFQVTNDKLTTFDHSKSFGSEQVRIVNFYRFEGVSDPGDEMVLYVIETDDGTKGTLADGYNAYAGEDVSKFIVEVEKIQKVKATDLHA